MKKLSFILALILVIACVSLVSCGGESENSSTADSSVVESTANDSSKEAENSEAAESSAVVESSEEVEPDISMEAPAEPIEITGEVISVGCEYEVPGGKGYVVEDDQWPANYTADLTDGIAVDKLVYDSSWFSFNSEPDIDGESNRIDGVGTVIIDLGEEKNVTGVRTNVYTGNESSIAPVGSVIVWVSNDGENFSNPISLTVPELNTIGWAEGGFEAVSARYVKVEYTVGGEGHHMFTNEIEVYGN